MSSAGVFDSTLPQTALSIKQPAHVQCATNAICAVQSVVCNHGCNVSFGQCAPHCCLCRKLVDTPFPFPWAQTMQITLVMWCLLFPIYVASFTTNVVLAAVLSFISVQTFYMLNEVSRDIEEPFHYTPNELPLPQLQYRFNERLLAATCTQRPAAFTDFGALVGPGNTPAVCNGQVVLSCWSGG